MFLDLLREKIGIELKAVLTHCLESFTSPVFHPLCDGIALDRPEGHLGAVRAFEDVTLDAWRVLG